MPCYQMPKLKPSEGSHVAYGTDSLKDIFVWGDVLGSVLDDRDTSKANISLPRLLNSTQILDVQNVSCVKALTDSDFAQVSCAKALTVALTITGVVFAIGSKEHGQLGSHRLDDSSICSVEGSLKTEFVREISSGSSHVAVLTMNGKVFTWGKGTEGQLGLGDYVDRSSPTLVEALEDKQVDSIACGSNFTVAVCLHRSISGKDQSVCSSCRLSFSFARKKHNCYNCGSMFCNSIREIRTWLPQIN